MWLPTKLNTRPSSLFMDTQPFPYQERRYSRTTISSSIVALGQTHPAGRSFYKVNTPPLIQSTMSSNPSIYRKPTDTYNRLRQVTPRAKPWNLCHGPTYLNVSSAHRGARSSVVNPPGTTHTRYRTITSHEVRYIF
ncbi:uncharacterized protein CLUP02_08644 [Colletotrichum lupini]|uniref:Uncharacterized protein n=1 Tax=Colletotrichum lupini TaxID=145971 RepID=A0A9Q8WH77_9PEZI|nr:uncharacterized protein CLUP02_08644 [Colletotrichum lupini]UQC83151.1 hypothetical protein CLUP02_08644 [Colletotrichum lupini]